ncbi:MAG: Stp1/IreP family PP2C-type Ser/Thr phosphatase [Glaciimonas sp.]|nr:Stp1/IreP family PP2C-type Ser/Thr phosphatase [Glaciimonas sp.]
MPNHLQFSFFARTDIGLVRQQNEDAIAVREGLQLAVLADGMGGYNAGEVASSIAIAVIPEEVERQLHENQYHHPDDQVAMRRLCLMQAVRKANTEIILAARKDPTCRGMGTTVVVAWLQQTSICIAHVGDSRVYCLRKIGSDGELMQLTRDHSVLQEQIDAGLVTPEEATLAMNRNVITRAVGVDPQLTVEVHEYALQAGDLYLLCSDGLSDRLSADEIKRIIMGVNTDADSDLGVASDALILAANAAGGQDNISVILIEATSIKNLA